MPSVHYATDLAAPSRPSAARWGVALLVLGLVASGVTGLRLQHDRSVHTEGEDTLARLESALAERGAASRAAATRVPTAAERRLQADLSRLSGDLFRPWFPMLDALEASAVPKVTVQQLSVDAGFSKLQLRVDAADLPEVLRYVQALGSVGAPLQGAQLLGHEWVLAGGAPRRLQARITVGLVPLGAAVGLMKVPPAPNVNGCGPAPAMRCLSAKAAP